MPNSTHPELQGSVAVRGETLREQRKRKFSSALAFAEACGSVSLPTVYRAEKGGPVMQSYLARMAKELDLPIDRLIATEVTVDRISTEITLTGEWLGLFVESDRQGVVNIVKEDSELVQTGLNVTGYSTIESPDGKRTETFVDCVFKDNVFFGKTVPNDWAFPLDCGAFVLSGTRNLDWMKGHTTWFDFDTELPEVSRYLFCRKSAPDFEQLVAQAEKSLEAEVKFFRLRKFLENGYDFETSVALVKTIETQL